MVTNEESEMVRNNVWMSTVRMPVFTVELTKHDTYVVVEWQNGVFGAIGRKVDGHFYDKDDAIASLQACYHDYTWELQHAA